MIGISAYEHGTKHPICAISILDATYLIYVLFPPMLGPVMICKFDNPFAISQSLAMH